MHSKRMFVTDFDGTLADDNSEVSESTISELEKLTSKDIVRVVATGRSLFSLKTVIDSNFPIDFLVFSSGIGVYDWKNQILLQENSINEEDTSNIYNYLVENDYDFMVQLPVPNNHFFHHKSSGKLNEDFNTRVNYYESHGVETIVDCPQNSSQFVIICPEEADSLRVITEKFNHLKVVKATSPLDRKSIWVEILPQGISKASGIEFLRKRLDVHINEIVSVGNDYYDLDMLKYTLNKNSFVVSNAPKELRSEFNVIESNLNNGVSKLIKQLYNID